MAVLIMPTPMAMGMALGHWRLKCPKPTTLPRFFQLAFMSKYYCLSANKDRTPFCPRLTETPLIKTEEYRPIRRPTWKQLPSLYKDLSKAKLSLLVVFTTFAGYALAPYSHSLLFPPEWSYVGLVHSLPAYALLGCTLAGTALCSFSANALNQWMEAPFDAQMARTRARVLPRHALSPPHAFAFALVSGSCGLSLLATQVSALSAALAAGTIFLYVLVYTPFKRWSIWNTWIGAVVGAVPPLIGWAAASGSTAALALAAKSVSLPMASSLSTLASASAPVSASLSFLDSFSFLGLGSGAWILAAILYAWQFPHFNSLSWNLRKDYSKAGYRMSSVLDPDLNARVSMRYALALVPITCAAHCTGLTDAYFLLTGNLVNAILIVFAYRFYRSREPKAARQLFFASLLHLPLLLIFLFIHKNNGEPKEERAQ